MAFNSTNAKLKYDSLLSRLLLLIDIIWTITTWVISVPLQNYGRKNRTMICFREKFYFICVWSMQNGKWAYFANKKPPTINHTKTPTTTALMPRMNETNGHTGIPKYQWVCWICIECQHGGDIILFFYSLFRFRVAILQEKDVQNINFPK